MLDSGALFHFSGDINDFVDYTQMENKIPLKTANSSASIEGKGMIILVLSTGETVWIYPVFYIPSLTCKLLLLGTFLQDGFQVIGVAHFIMVLRGHLPFLTFTPRSEKDSIYIIRALAACKVDLHSAVTSIYLIDYEMVHKRLAHPSKDVLQKARKHLKDFPEIEIPSEEHVCPGCAQGKMTNHPFPATTRRASQPFELIHSDLKSFPIESYHRFKHVIVFFDDYSSSAWTVNLCTKDAALTTTSQFLTYVELQYSSKVQQWMSNAGGEYKSAAFNKMLKDRGIKILQSVPYVHQQNGRAEWIICTLMDKAESMRFQACIPQSWWEFSVEHATHVYNQTPLWHLNWHTPYELLNNEVPSVSHLRVFSCGAYIYLPAETRTNKLAPKSEMMTYLGNAPGASEFTFMRSPNNVLFYAAQCIFDEDLFPKCQTGSCQPLTRLHSNAPHKSHSHHKDTISVDEEVPSPISGIKGKQPEWHILQQPEQFPPPVLPPPREATPPVPGGLLPSREPSPEPEQQAPPLFNLLCLLDSSRELRRSLWCLEMFMGKLVTLLTSWNPRTEGIWRSWRKRLPSRTRTLLTLQSWFLALAISPRQTLRMSLSCLSPPLLLSWKLRVALIMPPTTLLLIGCARKGEYSSFCSSWLKQFHWLPTLPLTPRHEDIKIWLAYP